LGGVTNADVDGNGVDDIKQEMSKLLPPDLADGLRMDINRPIGNGRDDNNNGVVDEPGENEGAFWASTNLQLEAFTDDDDDSSDAYNFTGLFRDDIDGTIDLWERGDTDSDGTISPQELVALHNFRRQMLARHLYVLAMTLVDPLPMAATAPVRQARARRLAQWAINIVDFRDPDNIMTAFEYDWTPFNGWQPDGDPRTLDDIYGPDLMFEGADVDPGGLVWGAERPELLITETLAPWTVSGRASTRSTNLMTNPSVMGSETCGQERI